MIQRLIALFLLILLLPLWIIFCVFIKIDSKGPCIFKQKRMGKDKKIFTMYKLRTMVWNAESLKKKLMKLNEVDGPVFKIKNDPRFTRFGKVLSDTGLDELPQLVNIIKGEIAFVGPRPLPVKEALKVPKKYKKRFEVLPGVTSPWVLKGQHELNFSKWMELDLIYIKNKSGIYDLKISLATVFLVLKLIWKKFI
jgi:lipopolysaccharide/colanic/teichoic acid biosynthesis glycosyltransferase